MRAPRRPPPFPPAWYGIAAPRLAWALDTVWRWHRRRNAAAELQELDADQLADIGIERAEIAAVARGRRYGARPTTLHAPDPPNPGDDTP